MKSILKINFELNFEICINYSSFHKEISSVNSQLSKEINFKILFRNLEHVLFCEILRKKFHLWSAVNWSLGQCLQTLNEASTMLFTYGFQKFISSVKVLTFKIKFRNFILK